MRGEEPRKTTLGNLLSGFWKEFVRAGALSFIANLLMLTPTVYMLQVYDRVLLSRNELTLLVVTVIMVMLFGVLTLAEWLRSRLLVRIGVRLDELLGSLLFRVGFAAFLRKAQRTAVQSFTDLLNIRQFLTGSGVIAFFDLPWTPVYLVVMFFLHPLIGLLGAGFAMIQIAAVWLGHAVTKKSVEKAAEASVETGTYLQGKIRNIESIHAMGMTLPLRAQWSERHRRALDEDSDSHHRQQANQSVTRFIRYAMQSFTLAAGALLVINGEASVGAMIAGNVLMSRALSPLDMIVSTWKQVVRARDGFLRLENLLGGFAPHEQGGQSLESREIRGEIRVDGLSASAGDGSIPILHGLEVTFGPGELVVMVGPSGSGKSTFVRCLTGTWPETTGSVLIDGCSLQQWDRDVLGPRLGYVPQDVELFEGTLAENIARFLDIDSGKVIAAARLAGIHEMILRFPKGYDTPIGVDGGMLSGGQRQRVALARAFYGDPSVIILDEPNANLDDTGELALGAALRRMVDAGKTVLLVTHRPAILALADRIVMMQEGRIVRDGPRDEVLPAVQPGKAAVPATETKQ
ncbi:type I secretion system permease/ATPase [Prosthecochloris sp. GSB1]|uniref:type I secretion system permease/ATPase n=1 Tax=Prosthecochloris sp. GSB1 TaxID=281093 RepID=UPI000B8C9E57|nr:type I secretion system permease/ATPase [Prosthecochloris sp. GSB1]ASQ90915.1 type I secretion system permease/ATPase [Prosthecochloris sp. GSB1]